VFACSEPCRSAVDLRYPRSREPRWYTTDHVPHSAGRTPLATPAAPKGPEPGVVAVELVELRSKAAASWAAAEGWRAWARKRLGKDDDWLVSDDIMRASLVRAEQMARDEAVEYTRKRLTPPAAAPQGGDAGLLTTTIWLTERAGHDEGGDPCVVCKTLTLGLDDEDNPWCGCMLDEDSAPVPGGPSTAKPCEQCGDMTSVRNPSGEPRCFAHGGTCVPKGGPSHG